MATKKIQFNDSCLAAPGNKTRMELISKKRKLRLFISLAGVIVLFLIVFAAFALGPPAQAEDANQTEKLSLQEQIHQIQREKENLTKKLSEVKSEQDAAVQELDLISQQLILLDKSYAYQQEFANQFHEQLQTRKKLLASAQDKEAEQFARMKAILRVMEESSKVSFWQVVFSSQNIPDLINRITLMREVVVSEKEKLEDLVSLRKDIAEDRYQVQKQEAEYQELLRDLEREKAEKELRNAVLQQKISALMLQHSNLITQLGAYVPTVSLDEKGTKLTQPLDPVEIVDFLTRASEELKLAGRSTEESEKRLGILREGLGLVGRVPYFWGGRSYYPGWNNLWNTMQPIRHAGSEHYQPLGQSFPYGLDCGGFVFWAALTMYGQDSWNSPVEWMSGVGARGIYSGSTPVEWGKKLPGDIVVNTPLTHIGYYLCTTENGEELYLHSCGGYGVVVSTSVLCKFDRAADIGL